ncbi:MAG TPA: FAD-dependent oxidoreductase, partial [Phycisphaerae bacterium]|nr:FAD-dependent oxidoreductase [Phycisphaerae bacterium]
MADMNITRRNLLVAGGLGMLPVGSSANGQPVASTPHRGTGVLEADVVIVGGGMAGVCAAVAAARCGVSVILVQDRAVL